MRSDRLLPPATDPREFGQARRPAGCPIVLKKASHFSNLTLVTGPMVANDLMSCGFMNLLGAQQMPVLRYLDPQKHRRLREPPIAYMPRHMSESGSDTAHNARSLTGRRTSVFGATCPSGLSPKTNSGCRNQGN